MKTEKTDLCDFCSGPIGYQPDPFMVTDVEISCYIGDIYSSGGTSGKFTEIDCCADCFLSKVKPAIEALGVTFREREVDW